MLPYLAQSLRIMTPTHPIPTLLRNRLCSSSKMVASWSSKTTLLSALVPSVNAQRMAAPPHFATHFSRGGHARSFLYPLAFSDPFYSDYDTGYPAASQPPVVIV